MNTADIEIYRAARLGYLLQVEQLQRKIAEIDAKLAGREPKPMPVNRPASKLSPAARRRIAAAQKKRWQNWRAQKVAAAGCIPA